MLPILFKIPLPFGWGPVPVHGYGLMIAIGFLLALFFIQRDAKKIGIDPKVFADCAFYALPLGILGSRVFHIFMFPDSYSVSDPIGWIAVWRGGLVFQGGPPVVILFVYFYMKRRGVNFWNASDIIFPYLALAHGFGRVGCFLNGCCYGATCELPWAIPFRRVPWDTSLPATGSAAYLDHLRRFSDLSADSHWSHTIHPTQLYSFVGLLAICGILLLLRKHWNPFPGFTMPAYFVLYGLFRFVVEFFRGDGNPVHMFSLTDQQIFSVVFSIFGVFLFFILKSRIPRDQTPAST